MKKFISVLLVLTALLSFAYRPVFAAQGTLELLETRNDAGGGVIFVFHYTGDFNKNDFKGGQVFFGDSKFPMNCNIVDTEEGIVQCTTSRATAGQNVTINLGGFIFYTFVPFRTGGGGGGFSQFCYNVYDIYETTQGAGWQAFDVYCQDVPANFGDMLDNYNNPLYGPTDYFFMDQSPAFCFNTVTEDAYYWGPCAS